MTALEDNANTFHFPETCMPKKKCFCRFLGTKMHLTLGKDETDYFCKMHDLMTLK